jgi:hypothetical protein
VRPELRRQPFHFARRFIQTLLRFAQLTFGGFRLRVGRRLRREHRHGQQQRGSGGGHRRHARTNDEGHDSFSFQ